MKTNTTIINMIGGPGVGKSTVASGIFHELKARRVSCELITEYAKEVVWDETNKLLENQIHVFAEQFRRQWRLLDKVDYIITDAPLILNSIYYDYYLTKLGDNVKFSPAYIELSRQFFDKTFLEFNNKNFFLQRCVDYEKDGRNQSLEEAVDIDQRIMDKLITWNQEFMIYSTNTKDIVQSIVALI